MMNRTRVRGRLLFAIVAACGLAAATLAPVATWAADDPKVDPRVEHDLARLGSNQLYGLFVHLRGGSGNEQRDLIESYGLNVTSSYESVDVVFAVGAPSEVRALMDESAITYLEADRELAYYGDTGPWASRARVAQEPVGGGPFRDASGAVLDGSGVGVAVVDTGIDGTHPDLTGRIARNYKVVCTTPGLSNTATSKCYGPYTVQESPTSDTTGGHGTHVAGIVAGDGTASKKTYAGVAPGAALYGFGVGEAISIFSNAEAFEFILANNDSFTPRIRVINNSYGDNAGTPYNPDSVFSKLTRELVGTGVTVVFAAGNSGGNGSADTTSSFSKDTTPGVMSVANYNDANTGDRDNALYSGSSRGQTGKPATYPDISAPGTSIAAPCNPALTTCDTGPTPGWQPYYATLTGTSMAAPHVSGIAAMLYQAKADLTPAQLEDVLQDTAYRYGSSASYTSDPQNPGGRTSFDKGAGLVDVPAALRYIGAYADGPDVTGGSQVLITEDDEPVALGAADIAELSVLEDPAALRYTIRVRDVEDVGTGSVSLRLTQNVDGKKYLTSVVISAGGVTIPASGSTNNAPASEATADPETDSVTLLVPFSSLGNPPVNAPAHNVYASSFVGAVVDVAPGGFGADVVIRPQHGPPYTVRPKSIPNPTPTPTPSPEPSTNPSPSPVPTQGPSATPSTSPTPTHTTTPARRSSTSVRFTDTSARSGQHSDEVAVAARLEDQDGEPISDAELVFELVGQDVWRSVTAMTNSAGTGAVTLRLDQPGGPYELRVLYIDGASYEGSQDATGFVLEREKTLTTLRASRTGTTRTLTAQLVDEDSPSGGLASRTIDFFVDGVLAGSAPTNAQGTASLEVTGKQATGSHVYRAEFAGDRYYGYSVARTEG